MSDGKALRVYSPPLTDWTLNGHRDFEASKIDLAPDGSITLTHIEDLGTKRDLASGRDVQGFKHTILAIIGPDGSLRAETVDSSPEEPLPG